jgi:hypothetical protein
MAKQKDNICDTCQNAEKRDGKYFCDGDAEACWLTDGFEPPFIECTGYIRKKG